MRDLIKKFVRILSDRLGLNAVTVQFALYLFVGGLCSICDVGGFYLLRLVEVPLILASALSFAFATILNYFLCCFCVFDRGRFSMKSEFMRTLGVSLIGLGLNTFLVYCFVTLGFIPGIFAKIIAIPIVLFWNFLGRRLFVFKKSVPLQIK